MSTPNSASCASSTWRPPRTSARRLNPQQLEGQIEGGTSHGVGLALMEEIQVTGSKVRNPSFTDYLIPTILDMPTVQMDILELADPEAPYGLRGVGEPPSISSPPAVAAAVRAATGAPITRVPIRPDDIVFAPADSARAELRDASPR